ncbi:MAG: hypothetical protein ACREWE_07905 [Gammaproteobacteria bacterium]
MNDKPDGSPYRMVGIPDGLGAYDNHDGTFTVVMNHELRKVAGVPRAHGGIGAFVSQWTIRKHDLEVSHGGDLNQASLSLGPRRFRLCARRSGHLQPLLRRRSSRAPMPFSTARAGAAIPALCS